MSATEREYRVVWKREGQSRTQTRRYQRRDGAERLLGLLAGDPHNGCAHEEGYCYWETGGGNGIAPPFEVEPRIESREVGRWT